MAWGQWSWCVGGLLRMGCLHNYIISIFIFFCKFCSTLKLILDPPLVPIHRKVDKQLVENCRPNSLFPICGKVFERIVINDLSKYVKENNLLYPQQSGVITGNSCVQQLRSITHEIYKASDCSHSLEV